MEAKLQGRDVQVEGLDAFLNESGRDSLLVVSGDPGVGKSALLEFIGDRASLNGTRVLRARALEFEAELPYSTVNQLLLPLIDSLAQLAPDHQKAIGIICGLRTGAMPGLLVAGAAVLSLLQMTAAKSHSLLLMVDDSPWMDLLSAMTLTYLGRRLRDASAKILVAARLDEDRVFVRSGFPALLVPPLNDDAADALLVDRFPALSASVRRRIQGEALGNPLGLLELPAALKYPSAQPLPSMLPLTNRLKSLYEDRLSALPLHTREMLLFVVLAGAENRMTIERCIPTSAGHKDFSPAERAGVVHFNSRSGRWEFRHPLIRSAVFERSTDEERRRVHAILAEAFADEPERRAWHLGQAATGPDEEVAALLENVSQRFIEIGDGTRATAAMLKAAELTPSVSDRERRVARAAYLGSSIAGAIGESPALLAESLRNQSHPPQLATVIAVTYNLLNSEGDVATARRLLLAALSAGTSAPDADGRDYVEALYTLVLVGFFGGNGDFWQSLLAQESPEGSLPEVLRFQIELFVDAAHAEGAVIERFRRATDRLRFVTDPLHIVRFATAGAYIDSLGGMRDALWRVVEDGRRGEAITPAIQALFLLANDDYFTGSWDALELAVQEGMDLSIEHGYALTAAPARFLLALVQAARGEETLAHSTAEDLLIWAAPRRLVALANYSSHIRCLTALPAGRFEEAFTHAATISPPGILPAYIPHAIWSAFDLIEAGARSGRRTQALMHLRVMESTELAGHSSRLGALVLAAHGLLDEGPEWKEKFESALAIPDGERWRFDRARIRLLFGEQLRRRRERTAAKMQLGEAKKMFLQLGANAWALRADRELRTLGAPGVRSSALTPQESAVADLAATGLSNKQIAESLFLSPRTVSTHLSHTFSKLGISTRAGLRDALSAEPSNLRP
ncbi:helix-turn-helix transcriptional regulator [Arthrobacter sp. B2a2-09]|uniref:helix-turn-helix transcriptional regulator n=1 Tax=Arthrobacter sp. B2a2-09 TaxID=2952822 RepID=UPI0022CD2E4F|nr:LuxR family transcriptional regulator [Arthrobacter sp. B2a2-09]MCZ9880481.1 LuxR C-terminal-related transcriptional regulator [Arthrobacter sp. B2a2-09]